MDRQERQGTLPPDEWNGSQTGEEDLKRWADDLSRQRDNVLKRRDHYAGRQHPTVEEDGTKPGNDQGMSESDILNKYVVLNLTVRGGYDSMLLWTLEGIAIVMGCDVAVVEEALKNIREGSGYPEALKERLAACRCEDPRHGELFDDRVFDVLMDGQLEERLQVHIFPRREPRLPTLEDAESIRTFWERLKAARSKNK